MKAKLMVGVVALLAVVGSGYSPVRSEPAANVADFLIIVEATGSGVNFVCQRGCAWKKLSFDCGDHLPCKSPIDGLGMKQGHE